MSVCYPSAIIYLENSKVGLARLSAVYPLPFYPPNVPTHTHYIKGTSPETKALKMYAPRTTMIHTRTKYPDAPLLPPPSLNKSKKKKMSMTMMMMMMGYWRHSLPFPKYLCLCSMVLLLLLLVVSSLRIKRYSNSFCAPIWPVCHRSVVDVGYGGPIYFLALSFVSRRLLATHLL